MEPEVISACENICRDFYWVGPLTAWLADIAIPIGLLIALYQLSLWRREHVAKRKADTSLKLLAKSRSIQRAFSAVRSAMEPVPFDSKDKSQAVIELKWERLLSFNSEFDDLRELQVLHDALVGTTAVQEAIEDLFDVRQEIFAALSTLSGWRLDPHDQKDDRDFYRKLQLTISASGPKYDDVSPRVNEAISILKAELHPEIRLEK